MTVGSRDLDAWAWVLGVGNDEDGARVAGGLLAELTDHMDAVQRIVERIGPGPGDVPGLMRRGVSLLGAAGDGLAAVVEGFARHERGHR